MITDPLSFRYHTPYQAKRKSSHYYCAAMLRYTHDRTTEEFVNVGVLVVGSDNAFVGLQVDVSVPRLWAVWGPTEVPDKRVEALKIELTILRELVATRLSPIPDDLSEVLKTVIAMTATKTLSWSLMFGGFTSNLLLAMDGLFRRRIERYNKPHHIVNKHT